MSRETLDSGDAAVEFADERSLLATSGPAGVLASERLVRRHQAEALRAAYLLSGRPDEAASFANHAFMDLIDRSLAGHEIPDQREQLLISLATSYLKYRRASGERPPPLQPAPVAAAGPDRYAVADQRSRVMDALNRLEPAVRLALVLREFCALDEVTVHGLLDQSLYDLRAALESARARLLDAAGMTTDGSVRVLLIHAAIDAPNTDLWPDLERPVQQLHDHYRTRRRRLSAGIVAVTVLLLLVGTVWLFDLNPFGPAEPESRALAAVPTSVEPTTPLTVPAPLPPPTPAPEPTMPDIPTGNVPDRLIMTLEVIESRIDTNATGHVAKSVMYDPVAGELHPRELPLGSHVPSPDGGELIIANYRRDENDPASEGWLELSMVDAETGGHRWTREYPSYSRWVMSGNSIYIIEWDERPSLMAFHISTGKPRAVRANLVENMTVDPERHSVRDLTLVASPDESLLVVIAAYISNDGETHTQIFTTYALPELEFQHTVSRTYEVGQKGQLWNDVPAFYGARFTPDGSALYAYGNDRVRFLPVGDDEPTSLEIPFAPPGESGPIDLRWVTSNDGRYLYVIALSRMEVAVVDLLTRSVDLIAPFDPGVFSPLPDTDNTAFSFAFSNWGATLSPDGRRMYLLGGWRDAPLGLDEARSAIWVIDIETWRIVDRLVVPGAPTDTMWSHGGDQLIIHSQFQKPADIPDGFDGYTFLDVATGDVRTGFDDSAVPEWLDRRVWVRSFEQLYRETYGRMPVFGGVQPETVETASSLPRVELIPSETLIPSGRTVELKLRMLDPTSGLPLTSARPNVRYDPHSNPLVVLRQPGSGAEKILVPARTANGEYSGLVKIEQAGAWVAEVRFSTSAGDTASVNVPSIFDVTPSIPDDAGSLYTLRVQVQPGTPAESEPWTIRASFVDVESGGVIPENRDLESGLPESVTVRFTHPDDGFVTATLNRVRHGVYEGSARFLWPGTWDATSTVLSGETGASVARIRLDPVVVSEEDP